MKLQKLQNAFCALLLFLGVASGKDETAPPRLESPLERAQRNIERYRKGNAVVTVVDSAGKPLAGVEVVARQVRHAFDFGCLLDFKGLNDKQLRNYQSEFARLFNYASVGVHWGLLEPAQGTPLWEKVDREFAWGRQQGLRMKGQPLVWDEFDAQSVAWLPRTREALQTALQQHITQTVSRYRGQVAVWDVVNEPISDGGLGEILGRGYIKTAFETARAADPAARLALNETNLLGRRAAHRAAYFALLRELLAAGVPLDVIGLQAHEPLAEWYDAATLQTTLDLFASLGKPLHITELTILSGPPRGVAQAHAKWSPAQQAAYLREFYTLCFGHPQVAAITFWGLDDQRFWTRDAQNQTGGLLDDNWNAKPALRELEKLLLNEWRTNAKGATTANGSFSLRGFYGDYEVTARRPDGALQTARFTLRPNSRVDLVLNDK